MTNTKLQQKYKMSITAARNELTISFFIVTISLGTTLRGWKKSQKFQPAGGSNKKQEFCEQM